MKPAEHPTALRIAGLLRAAGIDAGIVEFEQPTRTSAEAAAAIGCSVAEIAKSIVFRARDSGQAVVVVASGDNRVSEPKVAARVGEALARADAAYVGMIGSGTKRVQFCRWLERAEAGAVETARLVCPIGVAGRPDKRPEVIAAFVATEILERLATRAEVPVAAPG